MAIRMILDGWKKNKRHIRTYTHSGNWQHILDSHGGLCYVCYLRDIFRNGDMDFAVMMFNSPAFGYTRDTIQCSEAEGCPSDKTTLYFEYILKNESRSHKERT